MARPGYAPRIGAETAAAVGLIEHPFVERGFKMKTAPAALPAELAYGSAGSACALRVDARTFETSEATTSYFVDSVASGLEHVGAQGLTVEIEGPMDFAAD